VWKRIERDFDAGVRDTGLDLNEELSMEERRVSPSDFGFHNAMVRENGSLCFVDFEYAGWDDPAKTVADFFCQPRVPVALAHVETMIEACLGASRDSRRARKRFELLFPLYRVKWCCIMLGEMLPVSARRRRFSMNAMDREARLTTQLEKARATLQKLS
jgi:hypothetical protein